jgi:ParB/RepB/Spo0J family partition protein
MTLEIVELPLNRIHPNPWNPNRQSEVVAKAERESIATYGFLDPVLVRPHPELEGHWQFIDGEHRWRALEDLQQDTVPAIVKDFGDVEAKKLTIILNETRGEADAASLGSLLADIKNAIGDDAKFHLALPFDTSEIEHLLHMADVDWGNYGGTAALDETPPDEQDGWWSLHARCPDEFREVWDAILDKAEIDHEDPQVRAGLIIERLAAEFLAGP